MNVPVNHVLMVERALIKSTHTCAAALQVTAVGDVKQVSMKSITDLLLI